jgi:NADPH:quinone reductase-like Zn-dependent oxidoreductase
VCGPRNLELAASLGADSVIDYNQQDFTQQDSRYDLIFDIVANRSTSDYMGVLSPTGTYVACAFNPTTLFFGSFLSSAKGKKAKSLNHKPKVDDLLFMKDLLEAGEVVPVIDRCYPLADLPAAFRYLGRGSHTGKVAITIDQDGN